METVIDRQVAHDLYEHFKAISKHVPLRPIRNDADYDAATASLNGLLDVGAGDEAHPLADLTATLGELIGDYDDLRYPAKDVNPSDMLRFLMDQHQLKQTDLANELGSQGVVSELLSGNRELNLRQMGELARRFSVPVAAFVQRRTFVRSDVSKGSKMKEPGLDQRHRDKDGQIQQKRSDTLNKNLSQPVPGFGPDTTLKTMREKTGKTSEKDIRTVAKRALSR